MPDLNDISCWEVAKELVSKQIDLSKNAVITCIRVLNRDFQKGDRELSRASRYCLSTLVRGRSVQAPLYYAGLTFAPEHIARMGKMTPRAIGKIFSPGELSVLLSLIFIFRKIQHWAHLDAHPALETELHTYTELGGHVGMALTPIGLRRGLLTGAIRHLGLGFLLGTNEKEFLKYRRSIRLEEKFCDLNTEIELFGTTHLHIAANLIQFVGLGITDAKIIVESFLPNPPENSIPHFQTNLLVEWIEALKKEGAPPEIIHRGEYYPKSRDLETLLSRTGIVKEHGSPYRFLSKKRDDVTPEKTPQLFEVENAEPEPEDDNAKPEELLSELSPEELETLNESDQ